MAEFWEKRTITCPSCKDGHVIKSGFHKDEQRFKCKACRTRFIANGKMPGMKFSAEQVGIILRHYYMGLSYFQIAESMRDLYDIEPSTDTLFRFVEWYTHKANCELEGRKAHTGKVWVADEHWVDVGGETMYHFNVMDADTRYLLASHLSRHRDANAAREVLRKALAAAHEPPEQIKTDKLRSYIKPIKELLPDTEHVRTKGIYHFINNNLSERLQNTFRSRTKTLRGLHSLETGQRFLDGYRITYNFFRRHKGIDGQRPGDVAKVDSPFREWADVVRSTAEVPPLERTPTPRARKGMANKKVRRTELRKRHREERKRKAAQDKVNRKQYRLMPSELDEATKAKLKPAAVLPTIPKGHQFKLEPIKETSKGKPSAPKPELPKMASTTRKEQQPLIPLNSAPRFMRPKPAGSKRH